MFANIRRQGFPIAIVILCSVSAYGDSLLWTTGTPKDVYTEYLPIGSRPHDYGYFSGYESATSPQRWVAVPFQLGQASRITNLEAYYSGDSASPTDVDYIIWNRQGLSAPTTIAASGTLGPFVAYPAIWNLHEHPLNLTLPKGDYYLTIYGSGAPNQRAGINWMAGAGMQPSPLEQNFIWGSSSFSTSGFTQNVFSLTQSIGSPPAGNPFSFGSIFSGYGGGFYGGGYGAVGICCGLTTGGFSGGPYFDPGYYPYPEPTFTAPVTPDLLSDPKDVYNPAFTLYGQAVPEPSTAALVFFGLIFVAAWRRWPSSTFSLVSAKSALIALVAASASVKNLAEANAATIGSQACQSCYPHGVSDDGSVAVGERGAVDIAIQTNVTTTPIRWTESDGFKMLSASGVASAVTPNGSVVVGRLGGTNSASTPFRWTQATGTVALGLPTGVPTAGAFGMSADGSIVMIQSGSCVAGGCTLDNGGQFYRWTQAEGMVPLGINGWGAGVSADGSVVVGTNRYSRAIRWTESTGVIGLGALNGAASSEAHAISADGSVVVGESGGHAFRWAQATGIVDLGPGAAFAVSGNGSVIVGAAGGEAFYWTSTGGMRLLRDVLQNDYGINMSGGQLDQAMAISTNGRIIIGRGHNLTESGVWRVDLAVPEPSTAALSLFGVVGIAPLAALCTRRPRLVATSVL